jgi:nucleotide-binding universal stress UspA family protein
MDSKNVIIWAIDPFDKETVPDQPTIQKFMSWLQSSNLELQPVHILTVPKHETTAYMEDGGPIRYIEAAEKATEEFLEDLGVKNARPVQVLLDETNSRDKAVRTLTDFSQKMEGVCIAVSSHGRSGIQKFLFGSFSEQLLSQASLPVLFLSQNYFPELMTAPTSEDRGTSVLFPTDFSNSSREAFQRFLPQAKNLGFELTLFHSISLPTGALVADFGIPLTIPEEYFAKQTTWANRVGEEWIKLARSVGVTARLIVSNDGVGSVIGQSILEGARNEKSELIAMGFVTEESPPFASGVVTREIIRDHSYPVWVYGPKSLG